MMTSALLAFSAIVLFVVVMAVGYLVISRILDNAERRRKGREESQEGSE